MNRFNRFLITGFFVVVVLLSWGGYSSAEDVVFNQQFEVETHTLTAPMLNVSLKSTPKLVYNSFVFHESVPSSITPVNNIVTEPESSQYTVSLDLKARLENLYKIHGFNNAVQAHLNFYSTKNKEKFLERLKRAGKYLATIAEVFKEKNLPEELGFLPLIESGFNPYAYSPKKAVGLWQFIPGTAKKYGLKIDWWVDERRDPVKSTIAAAEYLSELFNMFGSWNLALAAYNAGEGKILNALKRTNSDDFWMLVKTRYIKRETKNYIPSYIAATAIALDPENFGFERVAYHSPLAYDEVVINSPIALEVVAEFTGAGIKDIKELNPELRQWCTPLNVSNYTLKIPAGTKEMFYSRLSNAKENELFYAEEYTIKKGDTFGKISKRFGVPTQTIMDMNSLNKKSPLIAGSKILIPYKSLAEKKTSTAAKPILRKIPKKKSTSRNSV